MNSHCARYDALPVLSQNLSLKAVESSLKDSLTALEWFLLVSDWQLWDEAKKALSDSHCSVLRAVAAVI